MKIVILMENTSCDSEIGAEHGLCVYVETKEHRVLVDSGASDLTWENAKKLKVDLSKIDTIVLSHGHYDHADGLPGLSKEYCDAKIYMQNTASGAYYHGDRYIGIHPEILELPQCVMLDGNYRIDQELSLFTNIQGRKYWPKSNLELSEVVNGERVQDQFLHEQCLVIESEEKTLLISGCAHNGILNILEEFRKLYHRDPDCVISGFHMMKKTDYTESEKEVIQKTAEELRNYTSVFYTGHCTGKKAFELMKEIMGDQLCQIHAGSILNAILPDGREEYSK